MSVDHRPEFSLQLIAKRVEVFRNFKVGCGEIKLFLRDHSQLSETRLKKQKLPKQAKWIIKTTYKNGTRMYNIADPAESIFMVRPDNRKLLPFSYYAPLSSQWWDDDGTKKYREMFARIQKRGVVLEKPGAKD